MKHLAIALIGVALATSLLARDASSDDASALQIEAKSALPPLTKVNVSSRVNYTVALDTPCPGTTCGSDNCTAATFATSVTLPMLGASTLSGCVAFDTSTLQDDGTGGTCDASSGVATITAVKSASSITLGLGGQACSLPAPNLAGAIEMNLVYVVVGGAGSFVSGAGEGNFTGSLVAPTGGSTFNGIINMTGTIAEH
jgi:hypothetical protein